MPRTHCPEKGSPFHGIKLLWQLEPPHPDDLELVGELLYRVEQTPLTHPAVSDDHPYGGRRLNGSIVESIAKEGHDILMTSGLDETAYLHSILLGAWDERKVSRMKWTFSDVAEARLAFVGGEGRVHWTKQRIVRFIDLAYHLISVHRVPAERGWAGVIRAHVRTCRNPLFRLCEDVTNGEIWLAIACDSWDVVSTGRTDFLRDFGPKGEDLFDRFEAQRDRFFGAGDQELTKFVSENKDLFPNGPPPYILSRT